MYLTPPLRFVGVGTRKRDHLHLCVVKVFGNASAFSHLCIIMHTLVNVVIESVHILQCEVVTMSNMGSAPDTSFRLCQVILADFSPRDWGRPESHYTVVVDAALDNKDVDKWPYNLPLAPWY